MANTKEELMMLQGLPLDVKIAKTKQRIKEWVEHFGVDGVYISFSGGKDSTVLLDIARQMYPDIKACFVDTPFQFSELKEFALSFENVDVAKPKLSFRDVITQYGYPMISKEVASCVAGARTYVKTLLEQEANVGDGKILYAQDFRKLNGIGEYEYIGKKKKANNLNEIIVGGDRCVSGIHQGTCGIKRQGQWGFDNKNGKTTGNADDGQSDKGEYP